MKAINLKLSICLILMIKTLIIHAQLNDAVQHKSLQDTESDDCPAGSEEVAARNSAWEHEVIELINIRRDDEGIPPLKINDALVRSARYHSRDMADNIFFDHDSRNAEGIVTCQSTDRISSFYDYTAMGENIAYGQTSPLVVVNEWINSPDHYTNIISSTYNETGVGYYPSSSYMHHLWTQDFGKQNDVYPVVINNEAYETNQLEVELYIYGDGVFDQMRIKNANGAWTDWQPFQSTMTWQISGASNCTVHVERKAGNSSTCSASDDIIYNNSSTISDPACESPCKEKINDVAIFPNPLKKGSELTIQAQVRQPTTVTIELFDIRDQTNKSVLHSGILNPGIKHEIKARTGCFPAGIYLIKFRGNGFNKIEKMIITE